VTRQRVPGIVLDALGRRVRVEAGGRTPAAQVEALWSRCRLRQRPDPLADHAEETLITLPPSEGPLAAESAARLAEEILTAACTGAAERLLLLRAAGVSTPAGAVLGLVAESPALLASVTADLSRRGFGYVTNRLLATDESFDVVAFPEPIAFEQRGSDTPTLAGPDALGLRACPESLHLAAMVLLDADPAHRRPELTRVRRPDDVARLVGSLVSAPPAWAETALPDLIDETDGLWELRYGRIHDAAPLLAELVTERARPQVAPARLYVAVGVADPGEAGTVTVSGHHLAIDGLRRSVWLAAAGGASFDALYAAANRELGGRVAVSEQLVSAAVDDLVALGLLTLGSVGPRG
jgi:hypothetical protein